jgi:hypothetical protein
MLLSVELGSRELYPGSDCSINMNGVKCVDACKDPIQRVFASHEFGIFKRFWRF